MAGLTFWLPGPPLGWTIWTNRSKYLPGFFIGTLDKGILKALGLFVRELFQEFLYINCTKGGHSFHSWWTWTNFSWDWLCRRKSNSWMFPWTRLAETEAMPPGSTIYTVGLDHFTGQAADNLLELVLLWWTLHAIWAFYLRIYVKQALVRSRYHTKISIGTWG